jgi:hypothetical protein
VTAAGPRRAAPRLAGALAAACALLAAGCGSHRTDNETGLRLQREYLVAATQALDRSAGEVAAAAAATKAAWPLVLDGLPRAPGAAAEAKIAAAANASATLKLPNLFTERVASGLTGPASSIAGDFRNFAALSSRGWQMIEYGLQRPGGGSARFARANAPLYVESIYDAQFGLSQIGKKVLDGWEKLGGAKQFGGSLPQAEVERLAKLYSEQNYELEPRARVKLGS